MQGSWARNFLERRLTRSYIKFVCLLVLAVYLIVFLVSFYTSKTSRTIFGPHLGADFAAFYIAGEIFNSAPSAIYDFELQDQRYRQHFPDATPGSHLPFLNAPFFVLPFTLLSRLPYSFAYVGWVVISLGLFALGFLLMRRTLEELPHDVWPIAFLLGLSFMPFLVECLAGGQTSAVGFFAIAAAITSERSKRSFLSGLALSLCTYKPTLLVLILPMLVVSRRYQTLLGFAAGCLVLALVSLLTAGRVACIRFVETIINFAGFSTMSGSGLRTWKYVDINSFSRLLLGQQPYLRVAIIITIFVAGLLYLLRIWWRADRARRDEQALVWAVTIAATLVLNVYMGIYDSTLVVLSALLVTDYLYRRGNDLPTYYKFILLLLYTVPWITQPIARVTGIQLFTIVLALFAWFCGSAAAQCGKAMPFRRDHNITRGCASGLEA